MLRAARKGIIMLDLDGACPVGGALCDEGGPLVESAHASPNVLGQFGCPTCRFHVTGVPFLPGMVIKANEVIYRLRNVGMLLREVEDSLGKPGTTFGARTLLSNRLEGIKLEAENLMIEWQARVQAVLLTTGQIVTTDDSNGTGVSYVENDVADSDDDEAIGKVSGEGEEDIKDSSVQVIFADKPECNTRVVFEEASAFRFDDFLARAGGLVNINAETLQSIRFRRIVFLDRLLADNGIGSRFF